MSFFQLLIIPAVGIIMAFSRGHVQAIVLTLRKVYSVAIPLLCFVNYSLTLSDATGNFGPCALREYEQISGSSGTNTLMIYSYMHGINTCILLCTSIGVGSGGKGGRLPPSPPTIPTVYIMNFIAVL